MSDILPEDTRRIQGKDALHNNIAAARAIAATIKTTLGPKGMDKMIVDDHGNVIITNDGVTILREMHLEHPAAQLLVEVAKTQEQKVGDGTTTAVILAGELLAQAEKLIDKGIHPTTIIKSYIIAEEFAQKKLREIAIPIENRTSLLNIAQTAMTGKGIERYKEHITNLLVEALDKVRDNEQLNAENIKLEIEIGPTTNQSEILQGIIIDKERVHPGMPSKIENAKILLLDFPLEVRSTEIEAKIQLSDPSQLQKFIDHEENLIKNTINTIKISGATVVACQRGIDDLAQYYLAKEKILTLRRVKKSDMELLQKSTGAKIISTTKDINETILGNAQSVEERMQGNAKMTFIEGCPNPKAITLLLKAPTPQNAEECKRAATDALGDLCAAIKDKHMLPGAGATEIELVLAIEKLAQNYTGRTHLAIRAYAQALESIPLTLAENAGLDPMDSLASIRTAHEQHQIWAGINCESLSTKTTSTNKHQSSPSDSNLVNTKEQGIFEPLSIKTIALASATQVAEMILRIDDIILGKPKPKANQNYTID